MVNFLSCKLEEPIIKQYLHNIPSNASYTLHETSDSFISYINKYLWDQTKERLKLSAEIVLFPDEASNAARKEMLGIFISSFDEKKEFNIDFMSLVEVYSILKLSFAPWRKYFEKKTYFCLDRTNSMSGKHDDVQR